MKVLFCAKCGDIRAFEPWYTPCKCGNTEVRWVDPHAGTVMVRARKRDYAKLIGLNNRMLGAMISLVERDGFDYSSDKWRELHDAATNAPGYLFDKAHRNCWAVIIGIGSSNDVKWDPKQEDYDKGDFTGWSDRVPPELLLAKLRANYKPDLSASDVHALVQAVIE
jgi:hypothetical protein